MTGAASEITVLPTDPIVRRFTSKGKLVMIPARQAKRRRVLDWLAQAFEPGQVYPETVVNATLLRFHPDCAALRRYLVDEGFMERSHGLYWRSGGTFNVG